MEELIRRLTRIHNSTNNVGWGVSEYSPIMDTDHRKCKVVSQSVLVVGHNVYRKTYTMFVEEFEDGMYRVFLVRDNKPDMVIALDSNRDVIVTNIIGKLKEWFPEIRREL